MVDNDGIEDQAVLSEDSASGASGREAPRICEPETVDLDEIIRSVERWAGRIGRKDREDPAAGVAVDREVVRARTVNTY